MKTERNRSNVANFLERVEDKKKLQDVKHIVAIMEKVTGAKSEMWGPSIIGFGSYPYAYANGKKGEWFLCGISPRKQNITLYVMSGFQSLGDYLTRLGKHKTGKSCLYIKKIEDVDVTVLEELLEKSIKILKEPKA